MANPDHLIPNSIMIPLCEKITRETKKCGDTLTLTDIEPYRAQLPIFYHAVPLEWMRQRLITLRKSGKLKDAATKKGPSKGWKQRSMFDAGK